MHKFIIMTKLKEIWVFKLKDRNILISDNFQKIFENFEQKVPFLASPKTLVKFSE